ncbi:hypothetical protein CEP48_03275 [Mergibacter septicus]|uniref:DUF4376 domain-containing protein n=2 Tax=Mergibacter septicus TaxID=221402 RepID=A0A8D4IYX7_9PAST|nr:hypothetical protein CEP47_03275 [Mergibacter septicus]QDJ15541.1 hypothetical protein CEP48_03275 [Mergibacter septicus]UTU48881.1 DUF4376 domain-containing protein [Mergibacter septicus]
MLIEFAKQNYSDFSYIEADETLQNQLLDPQSVYQNGQVIVLEVDREALKAEQQTQMWEQIKQKRYQNCRSGVYVKSVDKWFHSDDASRQQYTFMRTLPDFPPTQWKTMDNSFVEMTKDLLNELSLAMFAHEQADFANAERHRAAMLAAENPLDYDYSTGWQEVFNG